MDPPDDMRSLALYRHPQDVAIPAAVAARAGNLAWLAGAWAGTRGTASTEERWGPPLGGALLGTSRSPAARSGGSSFSGWSDRRRRGR